MVAHKITIFFYTIKQKKQQILTQKLYNMPQNKTIYLMAHDMKGLESIQAAVGMCFMFCLNLICMTFCQGKMKGYFKTNKFIAQLLVFIW